MLIKSYIRLHKDSKELLIVNTHLFSQIDYGMGYNQQQGFYKEK